MPMMTCAECGASVSTTAHSCPACGAGHKAMIGRRPITPFGWAWRGLLAIIALMMIITQWHTRNVPVHNTVDPNPVSPVEEAAANARLHSATNDVIALKHGLRDPASLQLTHVLSSDTGDLVCIRYRARNGFGGMTLDGVVFVDDAPGSSSRSLWRRKCMHGGLRNITDEVSYAIDAIGG